MANFSLDVNRLPFGALGAMGARDEAQNTLLRNREQLKQAQLENQFSEQRNPLLVREAQQRLDFNRQRNPLLLQQAQLQNQFSEQNNPLLLQQQRIKNQQAQNPLYSLMGTTNPMASIAAVETIKQSPQFQQMPEEQRNVLLQQFQKAQQSQQAIEDAKVNYYGMGGNRGSVGQKELAGLGNLAAFENPELNPQQQRQAVSAYLAGDSTLPDGTELAPPSAEMRNMIGQISRRTGGAATNNQAVQLAIASKHLEDIPIKAIQAFAGLKGKARFYAEQAKDAAGEVASEDYYNYKNYRDVAATLNMDALRKAYGTSVVPDYVFETLGKITNPGEDWLNSPKQVEKNVRALQSYIKNGVRELREASTFGVGAYSGDDRGRSNNQSAQRAPQQEQGARVRVTDSNGNVGTIPESQLQDALSQGYKRAE